ncbi:MAG: 50S ribosomal protein L11 methyltransferase [Bryobacterales bacterium]|nr:50S ribosomal protein L11 methyltransferase [Bryobacterales bacterium]
MISLKLHCTIDSKDDLIAELYAAATTGIVENEYPGGDCMLEAFFDTAAEAQAAAQAFAENRPEWVDHGARNYIAEFQAQWQPVLAGNRFYLAAPWDESPAPAGRLRLDYQAGMACGSGIHPCTRLCLAALESVVGPGAKVLDVGAGSGILLMAAAQLGASTLAGCDIDHDSAAIAAQSVPQAALFTGSLRSVRGACFDTVIANISCMAAEELREDLLRVVKPNGTILVSGFRSGDWPAGYGGERMELEGWAAIVERNPV